MSWNKYLFILLTCIGSSCGGVKYGLSGINIPPEIKNVTVKLFVNKAPLVNPILAQVYTEKLKDKFINQTSLVLANQEGDWEFDGSITEYGVTPLNRQTIEGGTRNKLTISVNVKFTDRKETMPDFEKSYTRFLDFDAGQDFAALESGLVDEITETLIQDVFNDTALRW